MDNFKIGETLVVELDDEKLIGVYVQSGDNPPMIELKNVRDLDSGGNFKSSQRLLKSLIKSIKRTKSIEAGHSTNGFDNFDYEVGETLVVELENENLIGDFVRSGNNPPLIELENVRDFDNGYKFGAKQRLMKALIKSIKSIKPPERTDANPATFYMRSAPKDHRVIKEIVNMTVSEVDQIQSVVNSATYIFQTDQKYHKALETIKQESIISLHVEPNKFGRNNRTSLLAIATPRNIYIFDLVLLGKLFKGLKDVLQSSRLKKIVFYSNKVADNLKYKHGVELAGVFDIFVAHCLISKQKEIISFPDCANTYFNIPKNYFQGDDELQQDIYKRPLPRSHVDVVSKKVIFLNKLYDHMLHEIMLKNFYKQCNDFSVAFAANKDDAEVAMQMRPNMVHGTDTIGADDWMDLLNQKLDLNVSLG